MRKQLNMTNIIFVTLFAVACSGYHLPSYIHKCNGSDPELGHCIIKQVSDVKPHLKNGIAELGIPPMVPFLIPRISISAGKNLNIEITNLKIYHLDEFEANVNHIDLEQKKSNYSIYFERLEVICDYDMDGQLLILPIKGHGPANITLHQFLADYTFTYRFIEKNGNLYIDIPNQWFNFRSGKITMYFGNLFNGNKVLGDQMNLFLNENWRDVEDLLRPSVTEALQSILTGIFRNLTDNVLAYDLFDF